MPSPRESLSGLRCQPSRLAAGTRAGLRQAGTAGPGHSLARQSGTAPSAPANPEPRGLRCSRAPQKPPAESPVDSPGLDAGGPAPSVSVGLAQTEEHSPRSRSLCLPGVDQGRGKDLTVQKVAVFSPPPSTPAQQQQSSSKEDVELGNYPKPSFLPMKSRTPVALAWQAGRSDWQRDQVETSDGQELRASVSRILGLSLSLLVEPKGGSPRVRD